MNETKQTETMEIKAIQIDEIHDHPNEPRIYIDPNSLQELKKNIGEIGLIHPITVMPRDEGGYYRLAGRRRLLASKALGHETIPARLRTGLNPEEIEAILLSENLQRVDLSPVEEAETFTRLLAARSIEDLSAYINRSPDYIRRRLRLAQLDPSIRHKLLQGEISLSIAEQLACLPEGRQKAILAMVEEQGLNGVQLSNLLILKNNRDLQTAPFDTDGCTRCSHNSAIQPELFARETSGLGRCLNDSCWREKEGEQAKSLVKEIEAMGPRAVITEKLKISLKELPADIDPTASVIHDKAELGKNNLIDCQSCNFLVVYISNMGHLLRQNICTRKTCYRERAAAYRAIQTETARPVSSGDRPAAPSQAHSEAASSHAEKTGQVEKMVPSNAPQRVKEYKRKRYDDCLMQSFTETDENTLRLAMMAMGNGAWLREAAVDSVIKGLNGDAEGGQPLERRLLKGTRSRRLDGLFHLAGQMAVQVIPKLCLETVEQMLFTDLKKDPEALFAVDQAYLELLTKREIEATAKELGLDTLLKQRGLPLKKLSSRPKKKLIEGILACVVSQTRLPTWLRPETLTLS